MKKIVVLGALVIFASHYSMAQTDYRSGYIITNNNDTIHGLLNYKGSTSNAKKCIFKKNTETEREVYTPAEIKGYRFTDSKFYISKSLEVDQEKELLFLEYLIDGIVDIYYYRDLAGEHYLIDDGTNELYELKNEEKEIMVDNTTYIEKNREYIGVLRATFSDSPKVFRKVDNVRLNHKSLINIAHDYHQEVCSDKACIIYKKKLPKIKKQIGLLLGINTTSITSTKNLSTQYNYLRGSEFKSNTYPSIGLYYKMSLPFLNEKMHFQYEGTYSKAELNTNNSYTEPLYNLEHQNNIKLNLNMIRNAAIIKYEFPKGGIRPTFQIGGFLNYYFKNEYQQQENVLFSWGDTYYENEYEQTPLSDFDYGVNLGIGVKSFIFNNKEVFLDLKYQGGIGILQGLNSNTLMMRLGFLIG